MGKICNCMSSKYFYLFCFGIFVSSSMLISMEMFQERSSNRSPKRAATSADSVIYGTPLSNSVVSELGNMALDTKSPFASNLSPIARMSLHDNNLNVSISGATDNESSAIDDSSLMSSSSRSFGSGSSAGAGSGTSQARLNRKRNQSVYNATAAKDIQSILNNPAYSSPEKLNKSLSVYHTMIDTEEKTKKTVGLTNIMPVLMSDFTKRPGNLVEENTDLQDPRSKKGKFIKFIYPDLNSAEKARVSTLAVDHVTDGIVEIGPDGNLKKVEGRHNLSKYNFATEIENKKPINAFVDTKGVVGFYVGDKIPKTALPAYDAHRAIYNLRSRKPIARYGKNSLITLAQVEEGGIVESITDAKQPYIQKTQYPVLTIDANQVDAMGNVSVGYFGKIRSDLTGADVVESVTMPRDQLLAMMKSGVGLPVKDSTQQFVDITPQINTYFATQLSHMGKTEMPGKVYAYLKS
jgi:hypothetical protein